MYPVTAKVTNEIIEHAAKPIPLT